MAHRTEPPLVQPATRRNAGQPRGRPDPSKARVNSSKCLTDFNAMALLSASLTKRRGVAVFAVWYNRCAYGLTLFEFLLGFRLNRSRIFTRSAEL
jgi:hypothetical protein